MDTTQQPTNIAHATPIPPAQLWIGPTPVVIDHTIAYLQELFCQHKGCCHCIVCMQIRQHQHHAALWLMPEKQYSLDDLTIIGGTISFALAAHEQFFFIIQKADLLTPICANSLLKSIEEPPAGYHFILLTERANVLLPTIRSRCVARSWQEQTFAQEHALSPFFITHDPVDPNNFLKVIESSKINERESLELVDALLQHWLEQYKAANIENNETAMKNAQKNIKLLANAHTTPLMPGSSKIFWKNLLLQMKSL